MQCLCILLYTLMHNMVYSVNVCIFISMGFLFSVNVYVFILMVLFHN